MATDENKKAADELAAERNKFGFGKKPSDKGENRDLDEEEDMGDLDDEEIDEDDSDSDDENIEDDDSDENDEDADEDSDEEEDSDDEDEEDEDDEDEKPRKKGKFISFKEHNKLRTELRTALRTIKEVTQKNAELEAKLPDDFQERMEALAKEVGVEDPDGLKKILKFIDDVVVKKHTAGIEKKLSDLEQRTVTTDTNAISDAFRSEWESFEDEFFSKEFPNATKEQTREARKLMFKLSHMKDIGGKTYTDKTGKVVLDPYPLDYILHRNRDKFADIVTGKKMKGMSVPRTQGNRSNKNDNGDEIPHLNKNSTTKDVRNLMNKYANIEAGGSDRFRAPDNSEI